MEIGINTEQRRFHVRKHGVPVFDVIDWGDNNILSYPANSELSAIIQKQDGTFTPRLTNDEGYEEEVFDNEGYDSSE